MRKVGITGQNGFVGSYLYNTLSLLKEEFELVSFEKDWFQSEDKLVSWVSKCDVIVHLAAMNRHPDMQVIHDTNINLVEKLVAAMKKSACTPHVIFSSSTQEEKDNLYGQSKKTGRNLFVKWATDNNAVFTGLVVPNVFGPFGKPFYNSVVATFCSQLCNNQQPKIDVDGYLKLIYVGELVQVIIKSIREKINLPDWQVEHTSEHYVSQILALLTTFRDQYYVNGTFPELNDVFSVNLFNTYRSYIDHKSYFPFTLKPHADNRGVFVELIKLHQGGQVSFSTTHPGITRGNHFHTRKIERFAVIKGKALIQLRKYGSGEVMNFELDGNQPSYVDMPIWYTHNIKNIGTDDLYTIFWINEFFNAADPDTYFETV